MTSVSSSAQVLERLKALHDAVLSMNRRDRTKREDELQRLARAKADLRRQLQRAS